MSKMYRIDLCSLSPAERETVYEQIDGVAFMVSRVSGTGGLEAIDVFWTAEDDFLSSKLIPPGCSCRQL